MVNPTWASAAVDPVPLLPDDPVESASTQQSIERIAGVSFSSDQWRQLSRAYHMFQIDAGWALEGARQKDVTAALVGFRDAMMKAAEAVALADMLLQPVAETMSGLYSQSGTKAEREVKQAMREALDPSTESLSDKVDAIEAACRGVSYAAAALALMPADVANAMDDVERHTKPSSGLRTFVRVVCEVVADAGGDLSIPRKSDHLGTWSDGAICNTITAILRPLDHFRHYSQPSAICGAAQAVVADLHRA